jgi:hypothetical protein
VDWLVLCRLIRIIPVTEPATGSLMGELSALRA